MCFNLKALAAIPILALFVGACDGSLLTPGPALTGSTSSGSTTRSIRVQVTTSSATVQATTPVLISASIAQNGSAVANGTQVTFVTNMGTFMDSSSPTTAQTTSNGMAAASFTSRTAGVATVTVSVNGTSELSTVVFTQPPTM